MPAKNGHLSLYVPPAELQQWRDEHRATYPAHGLSFNAWLLRRIRGEGESDWEATKNF